jgi:predicted TIM-barrel fold metal-dependent hydrolase
MNRRVFVASSLCVWGASRTGRAAVAGPGTADDGQIDLALGHIPNFCTHEHWGSIASVEPSPGGFRADFVAGARPRRRTTLIDLLIDPYFNGCLLAAGVDANAIARDKLGGDVSQAGLDDIAATLAALRSGLRPQQLTGAYQCIRMGIFKAYGIDINTDDPAAIRELDAAIGKNYEDIFAWYKRLMRRANFSELIRPVHPEYYVEKESDESAAMERTFTRTIMRIDPFMDLWKADSSRRRRLAEIAGVEPTDAASWRRFLDRIFQTAADNGSTGIKQLQAYRRDLDFQPRDDGAVRFIGDLDAGQVRAFEDWVMHECCKRAHDRGWVHQVHVGTHNLPHSNPLPLQHLARRYGRQKIVMLHCWPFVDESGWLAKYVSNVYIDTCWQPVLNPEFLRKSLRLWLNYVPVSKITMGNDATSIEMAVGASHFARSLLDEALKMISDAAGLTENTRIRMASDMLHNNAIDIYGVGKRMDGQA